MKVIIISTLVLFFCLNNASVFAESAFKYQEKSLIQWDKLDANKWMDYDQWLKEIKLKEKWPNWERVVKERRNKENVGRVLACYGECLVYRGASEFKAQYRSAILEGDEIHTGENSYIWVFLFDGTLVRLSPTSSVTFKELNIGSKENFIHARINLGNVLWLSRESHQYSEHNQRDTDTLFLPLKFFEANAKRDFREVDEENLFEYVKKSQETLNQVKRLNNLIKENESWVKNKKTYSFLVLPNGTVSGYGTQMEFVVLLGDESYLKKRSLKSLGIDQEEINESKFFFRGFANTQEQILDVGLWYKIGQKGRVIEEYPDRGLHNMGEFPTKKITTILVARELMLKKYSEFLFGEYNSDFLALEKGYRLWGSLDEDGSDMQQRLQFLTEYTRRIETTNLLTAERFRRKLIERGDKVTSFNYGRRFFNLAIVDYFTKRESFFNSESDREVLNSTTKKLWKRMHDIR
jgi:hypothetical protein